MKNKKFPRIAIAGISGDSGKTLVSCGIARAFSEQGIEIRTFKKGPDYIDPAWLSLASKFPARNYDTYLMEKITIKKNFMKYATTKGLNLLEGNRGLYDGFDSEGTHSTAELSKLLGFPVVVVVPVSKVTRTIAAIIYGIMKYDENLNLAGVILNQIANKRQENVIRQAIEDIGVKVLGAIPKVKDVSIPARHLGLITPSEFEKAENLIRNAADLIKENVNLNEILLIAQNLPELEFDSNGENGIEKTDLKIGVFKDKIFTFYYKENLEAIEKSAELVEISSIKDNVLPDIDALYIGGGFPETNIDLLSKNTDLMKSLKDRIEIGLPVYAECGGFMYLCDSIKIEEKEYKLSGIFPIKLKMNKMPQGHGYAEVTVNGSNPFFQKGLKIKGHEFHYSGADEINGDIEFGYLVNRGKGIINEKDGAIYKNVLASYLHIHSEGCANWIKGLVNAAKNYKKSRS